MIPTTPPVPDAERLHLIERLRQLDLPEPEALFDAGIRHADYLQNATDDELLDIDGIGPAKLEKIREIAGGPKGIEA